MTRVAVYFLMVFSLAGQTGTQKAPPRSADKAPAAQRSAIKPAEVVLTGEALTKIMEEDAAELSSFSESFNAVQILRLAAWVVNSLAEGYPVVDSNGVEMQAIPDTYAAKRTKLLDLVMLPPDTPENAKKREKKLHDLRSFVGSYRFACNPRFGNDVPRSCTFSLRNPIY